MREEPTVRLYTRQGCRLCDEAHRVLERARRRAKFRLEVVDVDGDEEWRRRYGEEVPVIVIDGKEAFKHTLEEEAFLARLAAES